MNTTVGELIATNEMKWKVLDNTYRHLVEKIAKGGMTKDARHEAIMLRDEIGDQKQVVGVFLGQLYALVGHDCGITFPTRKVVCYNAKHKLRLMGTE